MIKLTSSTKVLGLVGHPIKHSLSPVMQNAALEACGLDMCYLAFDVQPGSLEGAVRGMISLGFAGFNVTIPYKESVAKLLEEIDEEARLIGAVNTVVIRKGIAYGYNTDGRGFLESLREKGVKVKDKKIVVIGAGGASKAVTVAAALAGAQKVTLANRTLGRAQEIAEQMSTLGVDSKAVALNGKDLRNELAEADIVINATPVGMFPEDNVDPIVDIDCVRPDTVVCDLVYRPRNTSLLKAARRKGCITVGGLGMLLYQGAEAFRLFTGVKPPVDVMRRALEVGL